MTNPESLQPDDLRGHPMLLRMPVEDAGALVRTVWTKDAQGQLEAWLAAIAVAILVFACLLVVGFFVGLFFVPLLMFALSQVGGELFAGLVVGGMVLIVIITVPASAARSTFGRIRSKRLLNALDLFEGRRPCAACLYDIEGVKTGHCPECGRAFAAIAPDGDA